MQISSSLWSRRKFLTSITGAGAVIILDPALSWVYKSEDPRIAEIVAKTIGIDTHNHIDVPLNAAELPGPMVNLAGEIKRSGLSAICMTFAVDYQKLTNPGDAYSRFVNGLDAMDAVLETNNMKRALNLADIVSGHNLHTPLVIQSVEGCHFLEGQVSRLNVAYKRGLRHLGLLHDNDARVPLGDVYTNQPKFGGLTSLGANTISECNRLGILVDLAHASSKTVDDALKVATKPVMISHTGLDTQLGQDSNMAKMMRPRLISKEQAKIVANTGGVIGVWTHLAGSPAEYAQNVRAMVNAAGLDHVCIGTDTKMTPAYRFPNNQKPGESDRIGERTNAAWKDQKDGFYYAVVDALLTAGFTEEEIGKIGGGNFCRVFDAATK